jgi:hypothetical protein
MIDKGDLKYGFWVGLGLLSAFLVWHLATSAVSRARSNG